MRPTVRFAAALLLVCGVFLSGCQSANNGTPTDATTPDGSQQTTRVPAVTDTSATPDKDLPDDGIDLTKWIYSDTLYVENSNGAYRVSAYYHAKDDQTIDTYLVAYARTDNTEAVTTLEVPVDPTIDDFSVKPVLFPLDITFDDQPDILLAGTLSGYGGYRFYPLVWDTDSKSFVYATGYDFKTGFSVDSQNRCILSKRYETQIMECSIYTYDNASHSFRLCNQLRCTPLNFEDDASNLLLEEFEYPGNGEETKIHEAEIPSSAMTDEGKTKETEKYFVSGSVWDFNADRWNQNKQFQEWTQIIDSKQ